MMMINMISETNACRYNSDNNAV